MMEKVLTRVAWFVGLILIQVLLLNHVYWMGVATPFVYVYFLLVLDRNTDVNVVMLIAFALGLCVDVFSNTPGVNAAASVLLAFVRPGLLRLFSPRDEFDNFEPGIRVLGVWPFLRYALCGVLLHHTLLFFLESFALPHVGYVLMRIVCSALFTLSLVMAIEFVRHRR